MAPAKNHSLLRAKILPLIPCLLLCALSPLYTGCASSTSYDLRKKSLENVLSKPAATPRQLALRGWARFMLGKNWYEATDDLGAAARTATAEQSYFKQISLIGMGFIALLRAEFRRAMEDFLAVVEDDPLSPIALVAARQLAEVAFQVEGGHALINGRIRKVLQSSTKTSSPARAFFMLRTLRKILRDAAKRQGDFKRVKDIEADMGVVPVWRVAGPFGKHPLADLDSSWPPEKKYIASMQLPEGVFSWPLWPSDLSIPTYVPGGSGILYAESFFSIEKASELLVRVKSKSPWVLFVDGVRIATHDSRLRHLPEVDLHAFMASKGQHRLLLKVASWKQDETMGVEICQADGNTKGIEWLLDSDQAPKHALGHAKLINHQPTPPRQIMAERLRANPHDSISAIMASLLYWDAGDIQRCEKLLDMAQQITPDFAFGRYLKALAIMDDSNIPAGMDKTRAREILDSLTKSHPGLYLAAFRKALLLADDQKRNQALSILEGLDRIRPNCALWQNYMGTIQQKAGRLQEARVSFLKALNRLSDSLGPLTALFDIAVDRAAFSEQVLYAEKLQSLGEDSSDVADLWHRLGKTDLAISVLQNEIQHNPGNIQARLQLSDLLQGHGQAKDAVELLRRSRTLAPYEVSVSFRLLDALERIGKNDEAMRVLERLSWSNPWHLGLRKVFSAKRGLRNTIIAGDKPLDGREIIRKFQSKNKSYSGDSLILLDSAAMEVASNGSFIVRVHTIVQVLSPDGVERWGEISSIPGTAKVELIRTISKDGNTVDAEVIPGKQSISLQALQVGSFVEFQYVDTTPPTGPNSWLGSTFLMALPGVPILKSTYSIAVPKGTHLSIELGNGAPKAKISHLPIHDVYSFELDNGPSVPVEVHSPIASEVLPFIRATFGVTWRDIRDGLRSNLMYYSRSTNELKRFAQKTVAGKDEQQGIKSLFRKVCSEIRQSNPSSSFSQPASHVLALKEGNRLLLLYALLRSLGYKPHMVLAKTIADPQIMHKVPSSNDFTYGLISLDINDNGKKRTLWMDPSSRFSPFDEIFPFLAGMQALDVTGTDPNNVFVHIPSDQTKNLKKDIRLDLVLHPDGTVEGSGHEIITTWQSVSYREALQSMNKALQQQALEAGLAGTFGGAMLEEFQFVGLDNPDQPLEIRYKFRAPAWARPRGSELMLQGGIYPYELGRNLIAYSSRKTPLLLADRTDTITKVSMKLPDGAKLEHESQKELHAVNAKFKMKLAQKGSVLTMDKRLIVEAGRIAPADYPAFKKFCHQVDSIDTEQISILLNAHHSEPGTKNLNTD